MLVVSYLTGWTVHAKAYGQSVSLYIVLSPDLLKILYPTNTDCSSHLSISSQISSYSMSGGGMGGGMPGGGMGGMPGMGGSGFGGGDDMPDIESDSDDEMPDLVD